MHTSEGIVEESWEWLRQLKKSTAKRGVVDNECNPYYRWHELVLQTKDP